VRGGRIRCAGEPSAVRWRWVTRRLPHIPIAVCLTPTLPRPEPDATRPPRSPHSRRWSRPCRGSTCGCTRWGAVRQGIYKQLQPCTGWKGDAEHEPPCWAFKTGPSSRCTGSGAGYTIHGSQATLAVACRDGRAWAGVGRQPGMARQRAPDEACSPASLGHLAGIGAKCGGMWVRAWVGVCRPWTGCIPQLTS
jgi:hypothetical protein